MNNAFDVGAKLTLRSVITVLTISVVYILISRWLLGFNTGQLMLVGLFNLLFFLSGITRKFIIGFSIFIVFWIIFDFMKAFPNYNYNTVHIADIYNFEKQLFGINFNGKLLTPNEYWRLNTSHFLDVMGGIFYLCWVPVPIGFAVYLFFFKSRKQFIYFSLTFFLVNLIGFIIYYVYPAAPPWYVQYHGFGFIPKTHGNTAGLGRFDKYFHVSIFQSIYAKSSNVFAAMPSLHSSYPFIVLYYGIKSRLGLFNIIFGIVMLGIWFTAIYASHHYILDVLAGILCAITAITLFNLMVSRVNWFKDFVTGFEKKIQ